MFQLGKTFPFLSLGEKLTQIYLMTLDDVKLVKLEFQSQRALARLGVGDKTFKSIKPFFLFSNDERRAPPPRSDCPFNPTKVLRRF
jgi:hypothetical protein